MVIMGTLLIVLFVQLLYLVIKVKNSNEQKYYLPALIVFGMTSWLIYKTFTMNGFGVVNTAIFSALGLVVSFVFTKHPPFLNEKRN
ncbi:hypothetical protein J0K78_02840 [Halobacillus sp. GSS1]|uniref:hypothetical protein n=1 Tax=Halobacillus sp. GSS1 TaxID=2815919 RepID=UPI001A8F2AFC|nr:hypothetical protein [Halobacillus sp. GSS1]MBN9653190.1 hypothetical protein [Halobacillus sp. GSS1]